jgi:hypothetical protein
MFPHRSRVTAILRRLVPIASVCVVAALGLTPGAHAATSRHPLRPADPAGSSFGAQTPARTTTSSTASPPWRPTTCGRWGAETNFRATTPMTTR